MGVQRTACVTLTCDRCADTHGEDHTVHYDNVGAARQAQHDRREAGAGWRIEGEAVTCPGCLAEEAIAACAATGHLWPPGEPADSPSTQCLTCPQYRHTFERRHVRSVHPGGPAGSAGEDGAGVTHGHGPGVAVASQVGEVKAEDRRAAGETAGDVLAVVVCVLGSLLPAAPLLSRQWAVQHQGWVVAAVIVTSVAAVAAREQAAARPGSTGGGALRVISYGGGVQSSALLVLAAQRRIDFGVFLMANVGDDSEDPRTLDYVRNVAAPYAAEHGIALHVLDRVRRDGSVETLWGRLTREGSRSLPIPVRMSNGAPGTRSCTADFKIKVIARWLKAHGAAGGRPCRAHKDAGAGAQSGDCARCVPPHVATVGIGISRDEIIRANNHRTQPHERVVYPLVGIGEDTGLSMNRNDCMNLIRAAGLPVPPRSCCFFCPYHRPQAWEDMRRERPDLFAKAVHLEQVLNDRRAALGKDPVWLTRFAKPLEEAIASRDLLPLFDETAGECDSGYCWT